MGKYYATSLILVSALLPLSAQADVIVGNDIWLQDPTPGIVFEDTDSAGWNWVLRGRDEYFHLEDTVNANEVIHIAPGPKNSAAVFANGYGEYAYANGKLYFFDGDEAFALMSDPLQIGSGSDSQPALTVFTNSTGVQVRPLDGGGPAMPFQGIGEGLVRFELNDELNGYRWRFTNAGEKFAINNVDADSPGTEMSVFKNGDVVIGGALTEYSDVNAKQDIMPVDHQRVLEKIAGLFIAEWSYIDAPNQRHIGPMAQDFYAAFGLGRDNKHIATLDSSGVALAGIQALKAENDRLLAENRKLAEQLEAQSAELAAQSTRLADLEFAQERTEVLLNPLAQASKKLLVQAGSH